MVNYNTKVDRKYMVTKKKIYIMTYFDISLLTSSKII